MKSARTFDLLVLPHLDAAFNLARWLVRDAQAAEDIVQNAFLRAFRYFGAFKGDDARPWLLGIVRNSCYTWLEERRRAPPEVEYDEDHLVAAGVGDDAETRQAGANPLEQLDAKRTRAQVNAAISRLEPPMREVIVLREIEGLAYAQIAQIAGIPIGTVMSRLSRARALLAVALAELKGHPQ